MGTGSFVLADRSFLLRYCEADEANSSAASGFAFGARFFFTGTTGGGGGGSSDGS
jgi:hypothetical protein